LNKKDLLLSQAAQEKKVQMMEAYNQRTKDLKTAELKIISAASVNMFDNMAKMVGMIAGEQSTAYKVMFATSKAFAIAEATIKIALGIAEAASLPFPANIPAIASVVAATAGIMESIRSTQLVFAGEKEKGGPVSTGRTYLVGEKGPELFTPASNGNITPNNRLGTGEVHVVVNNYTDSTATVTEKELNGMKMIEVMIKKIKNDMASEIRDGRGEVNRSMETAFGLKRGKR